MLKKIKQWWQARKFRKQAKIMVGNLEFKDGIRDLSHKVICAEEIIPGMQSPRSELHQKIYNKRKELGRLQEYKRHKVLSIDPKTNKLVTTIYNDLGQVVKEIREK